MLKLKCSLVPSMRISYTWGLHREIGFSKYVSVSKRAFVPKADRSPITLLRVLVASLRHGSEGPRAGVGICSAA